MTHPREALSAYLDGELPEDERRAVELHLAGCPACARDMEELAALDTLAREAPPLEAPAGYFDALPSRVRAKIRAPRRGVSPLWLVPLAAGVMVAVLAPQVLRDNAAREASAPRQAPPREPAHDTGVAPPPAPAAVPLAPPPRVAEEAPVPRPAATPEAHELKRESAPALAKEAPPAVSATGAVRAQPRARDDVRQESFAPPPPAAPAERDAELQGRTAGADVDGAAAAPAREAMADSAYAAGESKAGSPAGNRAAAGALSATRDEAAPAAKAKKAAADEAFLETAAIPLDTAASARRARDAWRRYVATHPSSDEARVRLVEAAVAAYRASGDAADRAVAEREADAYLARGDSPGADRVRAARRALQR